MTSLAVVACNNGLGHVKRVLHVLRRLRELAQPGLLVEVFVDAEKLKSFPGLAADLAAAGVVFHDVKGDGEAYEEEFLAAHEDRLKRADFVWSDNLVFPLKDRPDTFLSGSFLWFEVRPGGEESKREEELVRKIRPVMIANKYFATPAVRNLTDCRGVGVYEYAPARAPKLAPRGLLVSCGRSHPARAMFEAGLESWARALVEMPPSLDAFLEPEFAARFPSRPNLRPADFSEAMFDRIAAAAVRPGMGTISDVLSRGGRIFAFCEDANFEVRHNSAVLEGLGVGEDCRTTEAAVGRAIDYLSSPSRRVAHLQAVSRLAFDGLESTARIIQEIIH